MIKSTVHKIHRMSKYRYPTKIVNGIGATKGGIVVGHVPARRALEQELGRQLHQDTKVRTKGGNWAFMEPIS